MAQITVRNISPDLDKALREEQKRRNGSLNQTVLGLLRKALGLPGEEPFDNGLSRLAGRWSEEQLEEFERNTSLFEQVDQELWR